MTNIEKQALCRELIPDADVTDAQVASYLALAEQRIIERLYPFGAVIGAMPSRYDHTQCELAVRMIARRGGEGQTSHSENGISRTWGSEDDADILARVVPYVGVRVNV